MNLEQIYQPIKNELAGVEQALKHSLKSSKYESILKISRQILASGSKKLRPALVILSAKAAFPHRPSVTNSQLTNIATAIELIHRASLVHDDLIDHSQLRHNRPTLNCARGEDAAIAFGDYLYLIAFELLSNCDNTDVLQCVNSAAKAMCEGELLQICERSNVNLLRKHYLIVVKKKTAALFASSCRAGSLFSGTVGPMQNALEEYGLNFGIAFQMVDDCMDFIGKKENLGKFPGNDFRMGEVTIPILNLLSQNRDKNRIMSLLRNEDKESSFNRLKQRFTGSPAFLQTKAEILFYINNAKNSLKILPDSCFRDTLSYLAEYVHGRLK